MYSEAHLSCDLLDVEDEDVFDGVDGGQQGAVEGADPADGLTIDDLQHVLRDGELLLTPPPHQTVVAVTHDDPETTRRLSDTHLRGTGSKTQNISTNIFILPGKLHEDSDGDDDQEVEDHELVHLLPDMSLPALQDNTLI